MTCSECQECGRPIADCSCQECNPCKQKERECCVPNIVADWDCITVETDSEWVIHLNTRCNPRIISRDGSVDVTLDDTWDVDVWNLQVEDSDRLVAACWNDQNPSTLDEKIVWVGPIIVTPVCSNNGRIEIGLDESQLSSDDKKVAIRSWCPSKYLSEALRVESQYIKMVENDCGLLITDNRDGNWLYYAKLVLAKDHIWWNIPADNNWIAEKYLWQKAPVEWMPVKSWFLDLYAPSSLRSWLGFYWWTNDNPWYWWIKITKRWLYQVWFTWSAEFNYWVHAFRVQLYRLPWTTLIDWDSDTYYTICESRYSGPLWYEPFREWFWNINLNYVSNINLRDDDTVSSYSKSDYLKKLDFPLVSDKTEAEWIYRDWARSQSLWAVLDRVTVTGNTIVELDVNDCIRVWCKVNTQVQVAWEWWDYLAQVPAKYRWWHFALLWIDTTASDNWWEAWFSFYANLIHPF